MNTWWFVAASFAVGGIIGFLLGYNAASRRAAVLMDMLRLETEMYMGILSRKEEAE